MEISPRSVGHHEYSTTEIAVTGVFSAIGGGLLGATITYLLYRYPPRRPRFLSFHRLPKVEAFGVAHKLPKTNGSPGIIDLNAHLPPPVSDEELENDFSRLVTRIRNHADSYFGGPSSQDVVLHNSFVDEQISRILESNKAPISAHELATLLSSAENRVTAVRFLLSWAILSNVAADSDADQTLLPPEIAACLRSMSEEGRAEKGATLLESKWRHITGARTHRKYDKDGFDDSDSRQQNVARLVGALNAVLKPFANASKDERRLLQMREIIISGAKYGYRLFTQPTTWRFDWFYPQERDEHAYQLVVSPRLVQTSDDQGRIRD